MATEKESGNMLEEFKDEFSCCICLDLYNLEEKIPRLLKCSHSFCTKCLIGCLENDIGGKFRCPLCDVPLKIRSQDVANLQVNIYLTNVMEKIMNRSVPERNAVSDQNVKNPDGREQDQRIEKGRQCQTHNIDAANFCVTCDTLMCPKCFTTMTASSHVDHEIALVEEVFDDQMQNLIRCKALLAEAKTFMETKDSEAVMSLKTNVDSLKIDIKSTAKDLRTQIDQWETKSSNELNKILVQAERKNKSKKMADLNKMLHEINEAIVKEKADLSTRCTLRTATNIIKATEAIANVVKSYRPCTLTPYFSEKAELKMGKLLIKNAINGNVDEICDQVKETADQLKQGKAKTKILNTGNQSIPDRFVGMSQAASLPSTMYPGYGSSKQPPYGHGPQYGNTPNSGGQYGTVRNEAFEAGTYYSTAFNPVTGVGQGANPRMMPGANSDPEWRPLPALDDHRGSNLPDIWTETRAEKPPATSTSDRDCPICQEKPTSPVSCHECEHTFCFTCLDESLAAKPVCPMCGHLFRALTGDQPKDGKMTWKVMGQTLAGHEGQGTIIIQYTFPSGRQGPEHPNPGAHYAGIQRTAYLPASPEGHQILRLLRRAFDARLTFTIGMDNQIVWNGIHHKTSMTDGQLGYGYTDPYSMTDGQLGYGYTDPYSMTDGQLGCGYTDPYSMTDGQLECGYTDPYSMTDGQLGCGYTDPYSMTDGQRGCGYPDPTYLRRVREELAAKGIK